MLWRSVYRVPRLSCRTASQSTVIGRGVSRAHDGRRTIAEILDSARSGAAPSTEPIKIIGHIRTIRNQKRLSFAKLGDGSTTEELQVIIEPSQAKG